VSKHGGLSFSFLLAALTLPSFNYDFALLMPPFLVDDVWVSDVLVLFFEG